MIKNLKECVGSCSTDVKRRFWGCNIYSTQLVRKQIPNIIQANFMKSNFVETIFMSGYTTFIVIKTRIMHKYALKNVWNDLKYSLCIIL